MVLTSLTETSKAESSAYNISLHDTADTMSFTYRENNKGPKIEPSGTPHVIGLEEE